MRQNDDDDDDVNDDDVYLEHLDAALRVDVHSNDDSDDDKRRDKQTAHGDQHVLSCHTRLQAGLLLRLQTSSTPKKFFDVSVVLSHTKANKIEAMYTPKLSCGVQSANCRCACFCPLCDVYSANH